MDKHFEEAVEDVNKMEKYFTSAIGHVTNAIIEKDKEYKSIKEENEALRERQQHLNDFITVVIALFILLYLLGFTSGWYVSC